jgi:diadenosine tetraphosphate (Ap4A) HIT family hydrolase
MNLNRRKAVLHTLIGWLTVPTATMTIPSETAHASPNLDTPKTYAYHEPPKGVDYALNPSVFGQILRGEVPALILDETVDLLSFQDRDPRAKLHALVIPKALIPNVNALNSHDVGLLEQMQTMAHALLERYEPDAYRKQDYILCFHIPPFNSVDHLHLHVLAPASDIEWHYRYTKYQVGTRWCTSFQDVITRLGLGRGAVKRQFGRYVGSDANFR